MVEITIESGNRQAGAYPGYAPCARGKFTALELPGSELMSAGKYSAGWFKQGLAVAIGQVLESVDQVEF